MYLKIFTIIMNKLLLFLHLHNILNFGNESAAPSGHYDHLAAGEKGWTLSRHLYVNQPYTQLHKATPFDYYMMIHS